MANDTTVSKFTVRVLLHEPASAEDYQQLHERMKAAGFLRTILGSDNTWYELPQAEYNLPSSSLTGEEVRALASNAAKARNDKYGVIVTQGDRFWTKLKEVKAPF